MWNLILVIGFVFSCWISGMYDKYPELLLPVFLVLVAALSPLSQGFDFQNKWKQLEKRQIRASKANDLDETIRVGEEMKKLEACNTPLTLDHMNTLRRDLDNHWAQVDKRLYAIEQRLSNNHTDRFS